VVVRAKSSMSDEVSRQLRSWIKDGSYQAGQQLPPEPVLATMLNPSRVTLREALRSLHEDGLVQRRHGIGTFVNAQHGSRASLHQNFGVTHLIESMGRKAGTTEAHWREATGAESEAVRELLHLNPTEGVMVLERVRTADGQPVVHSLDYVPNRILPASIEPPGDSMYAFLRDACGVQISLGEARIKPATADRATARLLRVPAGELLLVFEQVDYDAVGEPVLFSRTAHVASAFEFEVLRKGSGLGE
jgi:GntR family transcriptional regulator